MTRSQTHLGAICALSCLLTATSVHAGKRHTPHPPPAPVATSYTFDILDFPVPSGAFGALLQLRDIANDGTILGGDPTPGGFSSRIAPDLTITPITCSATPFVRYRPAEHPGPTINAINNLLTVVGNDAGVDASGQPKSFGVVQTVDGTCEFTFVPDSVGTTFYSISDTGVITGQYVVDPDVDAQLTRFHGFLKFPDGTLSPITVAGAPPNSMFVPTSRNAIGDTLVRAFLDIQSDHSYIFQMFYLSAEGEVRELDGPNGEDITCGDLNNLGQATCTSVSAPPTPTSPDGWIYDHTTDTYTALPDPVAQTEDVVPLALNDQGQVVGYYNEVDTPCPNSPACHWFLATPQAQPPPVRRHPGHWWHKKRQGCPRLRDVRHDATEARTQRHGNQPRPLESVWLPAVDDDGTVVMTDGVSVRGQRHH